VRANFVLWVTKILRRAALIAARFTAVSRSSCAVTPSSKDKPPQVSITVPGRGARRRNWAIGPITESVSPPGSSGRPIMIRACYPISMAGPRKIWRKRAASSASRAHLDV
jgi:hypothetical protein